LYHGMFALRINMSMRVTVRYQLAACSERDLRTIGMKDRHRHDAAAAEVGVQVGQVADFADVRGLVQHGEHLWVGASAARTAARSSRAVRPATSGAADPAPSFDSRYRVSVPVGNPATSSVDIGRAGGVTHAMICGSDRHDAAVRAVSY